MIKLIVISLTVLTILTLTWLYHNRVGPEWYRLDDKRRR